jgi:hypothetical protein
MKSIDGNSISNNYGQTCEETKEPEIQHAGMLKLVDCQDF